MHLHVLGSKFDESYLSTLRKLVKNSRITFTLETPVTLGYVGLLCDKHGVDGIICTNQEVLVMLLKATPDFTPPATRKQLTLDDYQGSLLYLTTPKKRKVPVVVLNPLSHLVEVRHGKFVAERFISKLTRPESWAPQQAFTWEYVDAYNYEDVLAIVNSSRLVAIDIETKKEHLFFDCVSYACWCHDGVIRTYVVNIVDEFALAMVGNLNATDAPKVFQRGIYDNAYFLRWGTPVNAWLYDTLVMFHCWYSELPKRLDFITAFCVRDIRYWKDDGKAGLHSRHEYNAKDAWATLTTCIAMLAELPDWALFNYTFHEFPLVFPSLQCAMEGMALDEERFEQIKPAMEQEVRNEEHDLFIHLGVEYFNVNSAPQMMNLFKVLGCGDLKSADKINLAKAKQRHPLNKLILDKVIKVRKERKLLSTYLKREKFLHNRCLYELDPSGTDTARMASSEHQFWCGLQIQNIAGLIKQIFVSDEGYLLGSVDYSQSESRCTAYCSGDENLLAAVNSDRDFHAINIELFFGVPYEQVMRWSEEGQKWTTIDAAALELRNLSKRVNHGANYNMGAQVLLDTMGSENVERARRILRLSSRLTQKQVCEYLLFCFERAYPGVKGAWYDDIKYTVETQSMLVSALGWTRYCLGDPRHNRRDLNAYVAHVPQNLSVGIINLGFRACWKFANTTNGNLRIKAQIHDEVLFQYRVGMDHLALEVKKIMTIPVQVTDVNGKTREMIIPPSLAYGKRRWSELK